MMCAQGRLTVPMMMAIVVVLFRVTMFQNPVVLADEGDDDPQLCENAAAVGARNLVPGFTGDNRLVLTDWNTGEQVQVLDANLPYRYGFHWSPDCRFLLGHSLPFRACNPGVIVWNVASGVKIFEANGFCDGNYGKYPRFFWSPDNSVVLLAQWNKGTFTTEYSLGRGILLYPDTGQYFELKATSFEPSLNQIYWDEIRGWLWSSGFEGVAAFDLRSGKQVIDFPNPPESDVKYDWEYWFIPPISYFTFSPDGSKVAVHGHSDLRLEMSPAMTVYDIASGAEVQVNVERNGAGAVALSPDNRYLVMGYDALRVWDLHNLPESVEDRLPIYRHGGPGGIVKAMQFIDDVTIETTTDAGVTRWNLHSGEPVE